MGERRDMVDLCIKNNEILLKEYLVKQISLIILHIVSLLVHGD